MGSGLSGSIRPGYLSNIDQEIPDYRFKIPVLGEFETVVRLGFKSWLLM